MKIVHAFVLLASISAVALAQNQPVAPPAPPSPPVSPTPETAPPKAELDPLLQKVIKAYREAKNLTDTIKLDVKLPAPMEGQQQEMSVALAENGDVQVKLPGVSLTADEGKLYLVRDDVTDKYFTADIEGNLFETVENVFGDTGILPMHLQLRNQEINSNEDVLNAISMGGVPQPKITGSNTVKNDAGKDVQELRFEGIKGSGSFHVNPDTNFIELVKVEVTPPGAPEGVIINATMTMSPKVSDTPVQIAFEPGDRKAVSSLDELKPIEELEANEKVKPAPVAVGQPAPDFTLSTLDGEQVTLSSMQGSTVVLDFWATWCGPCKRGLPKLQEFANWAKESGEPVKVFAVDTWEQGKPDEVRKKVGDFWTQNKYTFPTLLDMDNSVVTRYGFSSIPTTVIVGPDGKIFKIHRGFTEDMLSLLKTDVQEALKSKS